MAEAAQDILKCGVSIAFRLFLPLQTKKLNSELISMKIKSVFGGFIADFLILIQFNSSVNFNIIQFQ